MNVLAIVASLILGMIASLLAAFLFPALHEGVTGGIVRLFGWIPLRRRASLSGIWRATWHVDSQRYPSEVIDDKAKMRQLGNQIYAKFRAGHMDCYLIGTIEAGRYITGTWYDEAKGGYHGAFQFLIDPATRNLSGKWVGFSTSGYVKHGLWEWVREAEGVPEGQSGSRGFFTPGPHTT